MQSDHQRLDDYQWPGTVYLGDVYEYGYRPKHREVQNGQWSRPDRDRNRQDQRMGLAKRARHGASRYFERRPRPKHLLVQHRVLTQSDGRYCRILCAQPSA